MIDGKSVRLVSSALLVTFAASASFAQTLQLPTFSSFTVGTTVLVPDQGVAFTGGIDRSSSSRTETGVPGLPFAPFRNVATGQTSSSARMYTTATIHDFDAMDQAILNGGSGFANASAGDDRPFFAGSRLAPVLNAPNALPAIGEQPRAAQIAQHWAPAAVASAVPHTDLAVAQADRANRRTARAAEAEDYFARGQAAETDGKPAVAKIYYQMAARRADGDMKQQVLARLEVVGATRVASAAQK